MEREGMGERGDRQIKSNLFAFLRGCRYTPDCDPELDGLQCGNNPLRLIKRLRIHSWSNESHLSLSHRISITTRTPLENRILSSTNNGSSVCWRSPLGTNSSWGIYQEQECKNVLTFMEDWCESSLICAFMCRPTEKYCKNSIYSAWNYLLPKA